MSFGCSSYSPNAFGRPGVRIAADVAVGDPRQLGEVRPHVARAERAVDADAERPGVRDRHPEGVDRLARQRAAAAIGDRDRDHHRQPARLRSSNTSSIATIAGLGVERVEDRLEQQQIALRRRSGRAPAPCTPRAARRRSSRETPDCSTSGEIDSVRLVGPIEPATNRGRSGVRAVHSSQARRASRAPSRFSSYDERLEPVVGLRRSALLLNVLVSMMSLPASRYWWWIPLMTSGRVRTSRSLLPFRSRAWCAKRSPRNPLRSASGAGSSCPWRRRARGSASPGERRGCSAQRRHRVLAEPSLFVSSCLRVGRGIAASFPDADRAR